MTAIRKAIEILGESSSKNKTMNVNEMNYVIDTLKDIEKQLQVERMNRQAQHDNKIYHTY